MKCPKCNAENREGRRFCAECGARLGWVCPECGFENEADERFCGGCGTRLVIEETAPPEAAVPNLEDMQDRLYIPEPLRKRMDSAMQEMEGENRFITALFADISGFTAMSQELSPEDAVEKVNQCFQAITDAIYRYEGNINRFIGDCVLAFFGAPIAHENDPERAIMSGLDMLDTVHQLGLEIKVGINTGMMYFGPIGTQEHQEISAYGEDINLAKRLQEEAQPGQIIVGERTHRFTRKAFQFETLQPLSLKGIEKPIRAYSAIKKLPKPEKIRGIEGLRSDMIGREREFSQLKECVDDLLQGRGQIISVVGEAGVGKSRLVSELKGYMVDKDMTWLEGRCVSIGESIGYWVFTDILRSYLEFAEDDTPEALREKIVNNMQSLFPQRWEEVVPYVGNLLSVRFGNQWDDKVKFLPAEQVKYQTFLTLRDIFHTLSQQKPLLLILEDMHWSDNLSLDLLNLLMDDLSLAPMLLLCVYRPYREHRSWHISSQASAKCLDRYTEVTLRGLTEHESRRLVQSLLRIENLPDTIRESILQKAEGNPFFVEEVIRSLIESDVICQDGDRWFARDAVSDITVPDTIQSVIISRIDRLEDEVRYVLQSASVIGRLFRHRLLQYTTQQEQHLDRYMWQLEDRDLVYEEHVIPELEYSFRHVLTQETAYNTILSRRRREFHHKVAEGYEALYSSRIEEYYEELAYHYSRSDDKQKALEYLVKAGDKSMEAFANDEAISYYNQALVLIDDKSPDSESAPILGRIYKHLGEVYFPLAKDEKALEYCRNALEYTTDSRRRAEIYGTSGWICQRSGLYDLALEYLNAAIEELGDNKECVEMARICIPLAYTIRWGENPNLEEAMKTALRGLEIVEGTEYYSEMHNLYLCLLPRCPEDLDEVPGYTIDRAIEYAQKSLEAAQKSGNSHLIAGSNLWLGNMHAINGECDTAIRFDREAIEIVEKTGHSFGIGQAYSWLSPIYANRHDWDSAIECLKSALDLPNHPWHARFASRLAYAYLCKGEAERAINCSERALETVEINDKYAIALVTQSLGIMEAAYEAVGKRKEFIPYCMKLREERRETFQNSRLTQWYLEPKQLSEYFTETAFVDEFRKPNMRPEWEWMDPRGDSSYRLSSDANCLEIYTLSGNAPWRCDSLKFPRLIQEISGDFAVEVKLKECSRDLPSVGGILVCKEKNPLVFLENGLPVSNEVCFHEKFHDFGRGRLSCKVLHFRIERMRDRFSAYCSGNGEEWMACGEAFLSIEDPIEVGVYAKCVSGPRRFSDRLITADTATKFSNFRVLRRKL